MFKYDGTLVEKCPCPKNKLNAAVWVPSKPILLDAYLFVDRPPTPKNEAVQADDKTDDMPKKKKMNLKWDEDADVFHKTEGLKKISVEDIENFNKGYDNELNAKVQKEKDAADKLERMLKKAAEAGKGEIQIKGPTVLQRGAFKRGEKVEKPKEQEDKEGDGSNTARELSKKDEGDGTPRTQTNERPEGQQKKPNKKEKDQPKMNMDEISRQGLPQQQPKDGKKPQQRPQGQNNPQPAQKQRFPIQQRDDQDKNDNQSSNFEREKLQIGEGIDQKTANQKKKKPQPKPQMQGKINPKQQQQREHGDDMNFANQGMPWGMMNNFHGQEHQAYPPGLFMMPQTSHVNPLYPAYMSDDMQPMNQFGMTHMGHQMNHPMMQMPYYPQMGHEHDAFDNGMNQNMLEEQYIKQMLNLNTNMQPQNRTQPKQNRGNNK